MNKIDFSQIPHLIALIDDESPSVRYSVLEKIAEIGRDIFTIITEKNIPISSEQHEILEKLFSDKKKIVNIQKLWFEVLQTQNVIARLGKFCQFILHYQMPDCVVPKIDNIILKICKKFEKYGSVKNASQLAHFLFSVEGYASQYHEIKTPDLENLLFIVENKCGSEYSLLVFYMLVSYKLNMDVEGIKIGNKIFALIDKKILIDFLYKGLVVDMKVYCKENDISNEKIWLISVDSLILEMLQNLFDAYEKTMEWDHRNNILSFINDYEFYLKQIGISLKTSTKQRKIFNIGQIVQHKKHNYRGVIVDFDLECQKKVADHTMNLQPWYYVLIGDSNQNAYIPQSSLITDLHKQPVNNPLVDMFFENFIDGTYRRNKQLWFRM